MPVRFFLSVQEDLEGQDLGRVLVLRERLGLGGAEDLDVGLIARKLSNVLCRDAAAAMAHNGGKEGERGWIN